MTSSAPPRLEIGVIGAGRVGSALGAGLVAVGHRVVAVAAVSDASRRRAAAMLPNAEILPVDEVASAGQLVLLAVPDDVLPGLVDGLARSGAWRPHQIVVHTSGARGVGVLDPVLASGGFPLAIHPAMTFTGRSEDVQRLAGAPFGITSASELRPVAETLVLELGGEPIWISEEARPSYHAALTHAANYLVTLVNDAVMLLERSGIESAPRALAALTGAALDNALRLGDAALTGPVSRGDAGTVASHIDVLRATAPELLDTYRVLGRRTAQRAEASGELSSGRAAAVLAALEPDERQSE